jgi:hypothetical protein
MVSSPGEIDGSRSGLETNRVLINGCSPNGTSVVHKDMQSFLLGGKRLHKFLHPFQCLEVGGDGETPPRAESIQLFSGDLTILGRT